MKNQTKRLIFILAVAALAAASTVVVKNGFLKETTRGAHVKAIYYCPMHPTYTSDRPGSCPICNMSLVKKEEDSSAATQAQTPSGDLHEHKHPVQGEAAVMKSFTVEELVKMKPGEICLLHKCKMGQCLIVMTPEIARLGKCPHCGEDLGVLVKEALPNGHAAVTLDTKNQQVIGVKTEVVKKMAIAKTIRTVGRVAYDPELYQAEQEYLQSLEAFKKAETADVEIKAQASRLVESSKIKLRLVGLSEDLIKDVEAAGKPDRSLLYSDPGGRVWLYAPIYEYEIPLVKAGDGIQAEVPSMPGKQFQGTIRSIDSVLDPATRSVRARAVLENTEGFLKPEMYVNASLKADLGENLTVPEEAVFMTGKDNIVFVATGGNQFEPRAITVGAKLDHYYEVKSGLQEGELVVTSGNFLIDSESRLKAALEGIGGGGGHQHGG